MRTAHGRLGGGSPADTELGDVFHVTGDASARNGGCGGYVGRNNGFYRYFRQPFVFFCVVASRCRCRGKQQAEYLEYCSHTQIIG